MCARAISWRTTGSPLAPDAARELDEVGRQLAGPGGHRAVLAAAPPRSNTSIVWATRPALVDLADDVVVGELDVVEELLAELGVAVDLTDRPHGHARRVGGHREPGEPAVLRHVPIGARQAHAVVGVVRAAAPDLRAVEDPAIAVAGRTRRDARQVGARARLGEELAPAARPRRGSSGCAGRGTPATRDAAS